MWICGLHCCHNGSLIYFVKGLTSHSIKSELFLWAIEVSDIWLLCFRTAINPSNIWELQTFLYKTGKKFLSSVFSKKEMNPEGFHWYLAEVGAFNSPGGSCAPFIPPNSCYKPACWGHWILKGHPHKTLKVQLKEGSGSLMRGIVLLYPAPPCYPNILFPDICQDLLHLWVQRAGISWMRYSEQTSKKTSFNDTKRQTEVQKVQNQAVKNMEKLTGTNQERTVRSRLVEE